MKPNRIVRTHQPESGLVAFVRAATVTLQGMGANHLDSLVPACYRGLERAQGQVHPGEGSA